MSRRIVQVFNRYLQPGGEEKSVDRIYEHLRDRHEVTRCLFDSREWTGPQAPSRFVQLSGLFYNRRSRAVFDETLARSNAELALFHNTYPVGSPSLFKAALDAKVPVVHFLHNFRPFSVSGTLFADGKLMPEALLGNYWREVRTGSWQGSVLKSALFAVMLKWLHRTGWLESVKHWVAISEFMKAQMIRAGVPSCQITALRHSWDALPAEPSFDDDGSYLFLGRLVEPKGIRMLLTTWQQLQSGLGAKTPRLVIAGEGPMRSEVEKAAAALPCIRYVGQLSGIEKASALKTARTVVVPSVWWEPLGLVVYEAYDYAKPVLAARSGGLTETVLHGETGLLHAPGACDELARQVCEMEAYSNDQRRELGNNGRRWLLREASPERWKQQMDSLLAAI